MADKKISELTAGGPAQAGDELPVARSGSNVKLTANEVASLPIAQQVLTGGTVTADAPVLTATQTWNNAAVTFDALKLNVTDTASNANSRLLDLQVNGVSQFNVTKGGSVFANILNGGNTMIMNIAGTATLWSGAQFGFSGGAANSGQDITLRRDAADTLAQRRTTNAQTFRLYNTFTDASNYERGTMEWASNVLRIGTEAAGTGTARNVVIQTGGTARMTCSANGVNVTGLGIGTFPGGDASWWSSNNLNIASSIFLQFGVDTRLQRDGAADTLAQRRSDNAQTFRIYQSFTNASNYTRGALSAASDIVTLAAESAGTGAEDIDVALTPKGTGRVRYGTHETIGAETVTGYIEIKDAGGTVRKLAVVS